MEPQHVEQDLESFHESSFGWALACCRWNRADAEEALQAAYLKAIGGKARFNGHASVKTWFFGVVKRTALEQRRSRITRDIALGRWVRRGTADENAPTPEQLSSEAQQQRRLRAMLASLSRRQRELLQLVFYHDLTVEEAGDALHLSVGTARKHYERGKANLRKLMSDTGE